MQPVLYALGSALIGCSWQALPEMTYTLQTSTDLKEWKTLASVWHHLEEKVETVLAYNEQIFVRLRYDANGDSNENGIPDNWELQAFNYLDVDPEDDPDMDGRSNATEWQMASDPLDFYNGGGPQIRLTSGQAWWIPFGKVSGQRLSLVLEDAEGSPLPECPIDLKMEAGHAVINAQGRAENVTSLRLWTDINGRIDPQTMPVSCLFPSAQNDMDRLIIRAGNAAASVELRSLATMQAPYPRALKWEGDPVSGFTVSWYGHPGAAQSIQMEMAMNASGWRLLNKISPENLPSPDPLSGRYEVTIAGSR